MKVYQGSITIEADNQEKFIGITEVSGNLYVHSNTKLDNLKSIDGNLYVHSNAKLEAPNLKSVGGNLNVHSKLPQKIEKQLWKSNRNNLWVMSEFCSDWLLDREGRIVYTLSGVQFPEELFDKIRKNKHTAMEVFAITDIEQRRVAYERMDKRKMRELPDFKVVDEINDDGYGHPMKIISFTVQDFAKPFLFLNCFCPSTGREYFIETRQITCVKAKARSFGLDNLNFTEEW